MEHLLLTMRNLKQNADVIVKSEGAAFEAQNNEIQQRGWAYWQNKVHPPLSNVWSGYDYK